MEDLVDIEGIHTDIHLEIALNYMVRQFKNEDSRREQNVLFILFVSRHDPGTIYMSRAKSW